jgi:hypothetical protein
MGWGIVTHHLTATDSDSSCVKRPIRLHIDATLAAACRRNRICGSDANNFITRLGRYDGIEEHAAYDAERRRILALLSRWPISAGRSAWATSVSGQSQPPNVPPKDISTEGVRHSKGLGISAFDGTYASTITLSPNHNMEKNMGRGILLWLLGVPIPVIILLWLFFGH